MHGLVNWHFFRQTRTTQRRDYGHETQQFVIQMAHIGGGMMWSHIKEFRFI